VRKVTRKTSPLRKQVENEESEDSGDRSKTQVEILAVKLKN